MIYLRHTYNIPMIHVTTYNTPITHLLYIIIWVFLYRTLYLPVAVRIRTARADTKSDTKTPI